MSAGYLSSVHTSLRVMMPMQAILCTVLCLYQVDHWFYDGALLQALRTSDAARPMAALLYIVLFGGGGLMAVLAFRSPPYVPDAPAPAAVSDRFYASLLGADEVFDRLAERFDMYCQAVTGQWGTRSIVIERSGPEPLRLRDAFIRFGCGIVGLVVALAVLTLYFGQTGESMQARLHEVRAAYPLLGTAGMLALTGWCFHAFVAQPFRLTKLALAYGMSLDRPPVAYSVRDRFAQFLSGWAVPTDDSMIAIYMASLGRLGLLVALVGLLTLDLPLVLAGLPVFGATALLASLLRRWKHASGRFRLSEDGMLRLSQSEHSLSNCVGVMAVYDVPASGGPLLQVLAARSAMTAMHLDRHVPFRMAFRWPDGTGRSIGLRHLSDEQGHGIDAMEAEFFIAILLRRLGFRFYLLEDGHGWGAVIPEDETDTDQP